MSKTKIPWCDETWNPVYGCKNDCEYCYARNKVFPLSKYAGDHDFNEPFLVPDNLYKKFSKKTERVFVNSMSDVMYWKPEWWEMVLERIGEYPHIDFIFLTKGGWEVYHDIGIDFPYNVILGLTVTGGDEILTMVHPKYREYDVKWLLNIEPLLTPIPDMMHSHVLYAYDWMIIGAETPASGKRKVVRPKDHWADKIIRYAISARKPLFVKASMEKYVDPENYVQQYPHLAGPETEWL